MGHGPTRGEALASPPWLWEVGNNPTPERVRWRQRPFTSR